MTTSTRNKWIVTDQEHLSGATRFQGARISMALLLELLSCEMTTPEIVRKYPRLTEEAIRGTLEELAHSTLLQAS